VFDAGGEEGIARLIRSLSSIYALNSNDTALQDYIRAFVAVQVGESNYLCLKRGLRSQYNALLDLASNDDHEYSASWAGPVPAAGYKYANGVAAADLLLAGLAIGKGTSSTGSPPARKANVGAIVGGVVGGVAVLLLALILVLLMRRRRRHSSRAPVFRDIDEDSISVVDGVPIPNPVTFRTDPFRLPELRPYGASRSAEKPEAEETNDSLPFPSDSKTDETNSSFPSSADPPVSESVFPVTSSSSSAPASVRGAPSRPPPGVDKANPNQLAAPAETGDGRTATIGSLVTQLNHLLQRGNHSWDENESPPAYPHGHSNQV
jgi:hypothetical protein